MTTPLMAISPLDGRYAHLTAPLTHYWSEFGLMKARLTVEITWVITLAQEKRFTPLQPLTTTQRDALMRIIERFDIVQAKAIKTIEQTTRHDVKALEYYIKQQCAQTPCLQTVHPFVHFGCTSEDINNLAYSLLLKDSMQTIIIPTYQNILAILKQFAHQYAQCAMVARTHGQIASPTTMGKECAVFVTRLEQTLTHLQQCPISAKWNGAVGHFNAHRFAFPELDWLKLSQHFVHQLDLSWQKYTTQIEPHDQLARLWQSLAQCNTVLMDCCQDFWGYISLDYFTQSHSKGQVGSSTMPHKVNPIHFENAEGNFGLANAVCQHLAQKLPISRWQRDLTDSTVMRNQGVILAHTLIALKQLQQGFGKLSINSNKLAYELNQHWEVLAEGIQTLLRCHQQTDAYETLKQYTQGKTLTQYDLQQWVKQQQLPEALQQKILQLTPAQYLGYATQLAEAV